uniref:SRCR domain-containing protein n=1 Tax=Maylandia zebra TaxID=106582 RepID=A0A3P9CS95_9CICH
REGGRHATKDRGSDFNPGRPLSASTRCSGRVEIYHNNSWGTVCHYGWDINDAEVVCSQLDCGPALNATREDVFGEQTGQIWLDDVSCSGTESSLTECQHGGFGKHYCEDFWYAGVICSGVRIRLAGSGSTPCAGRVEYYYKKRWGTVCDNDWDINDAEVVCRQLDCGPALKATQSAQFGEGKGDIWLDNVACSGSESSLTECQHRGFGTHNCGHHRDAGVICSVYFFCLGIRLAGSQSPSSGRVEIYHNNSWGTVCDDGWDINDAEVVCRQLVYGTALAAPKEAHFGEGSGPVWFDGVACFGNERSITQCQLGEFGSSCRHHKDAGVICSGTALISSSRVVLSAYSMCSGVAIRLAGSLSTRCSGRVEIAYKKTWGTVCDDNWDINDAEVVCRELNCGTALNATRSAHFGEGTGEIWLDDVSCSGSERSLTECQHRGFGIHSCTHSEDAGVSCSVRLSGSTLCSGRVEIFYNNTWGTVCDDNWDINDAEVVCRELGCGTAQSAAVSARFGEESGSIWLDDVDCSGSERSLTECQHRGFGTHDCTHSQDAGVVCSDAQIRLIDPDNSGATLCSGRVEIYHNNRWGTVCDHGWDLNDAEVVCRQLDCGPALNATRSAHFGEGTGQIWLAGVSCSGSESSLTDCQHRGFGIPYCGHYEDAGVICSEIRLTGPQSTRCSGRVEIYHNNRWGTVCDDGWNLNDAEVVCRQLGCGSALEATQSAHFGEGTGQIWLDDVTCSGSESSLTQCQHRGFGTHDCTHQKDAGVICSGVPIRLAGSGSTQCSGRVEIYHQKTWRTVCDDGWDLNDAEVVCRQLDCGSALKATQSAHFGEGTGNIWLNEVSCSGSESSLADCQHRGFGTHSCAHHRDAGVICSGETLFDSCTCNTEKYVSCAIFCIINCVFDCCSGRVEIYHNKIWGTVCDHGWSTEDAEVVCRHLGCGPALNATQSAHFGEGTGQIWLDEVSCSGSESSLTECQHRGFGTHSCGHGEDAGVICSGETLFKSRTSGRCSGRVEIYNKKRWGTVCDDGWDLNDAEVVCRQLDCGTALAPPKEAHFGEGSGPIWLDGVACSGSERSIIQCQHRGSEKNGCTHHKDAGVICSGARIRLTGSTHCSGRVEIFYNNTWGTVCDDGWDINDAEVVCRELNCGTALKATKSTHFGEGRGSIWLDDVSCSGSERSLTECQHRGFGKHDCTHSKDAGVVCSASTRRIYSEADFRLIQSEKTINHQLCYIQDPQSRF